MLFGGAALPLGLGLGLPAPLKFCRAEVAQRRMAALGIVVTDVLDDRLSCLLAGFEVHFMHAFDLQRAIDRLHRRVVVKLRFPNNPPCGSSTP